MQDTTITTRPALESLCRELAAEPWVAFDTEFVSEHTYRPVLCLIQVASPSHLAVIDPIAIGDVTCFWRTLTQGKQETIVHAGRGELVFCLDAVGESPRGLFDVQLAAAFVGPDYPAGLATLVSRHLGVTPRKGETRTDWRRRPLTAAQLNYALEDVRHLFEVRQKLGQLLEQHGRAAWFQAEMESWIQAVQQSLVRERWRKVSGLSGLSGRELVIVQKLWRWREDQASRRDQPPRQVLRDDLLVELAKRKSTDPKQVLAIRGMERGDLRRAAGDLAAVISAALEAPRDSWPANNHRETSPQLTMLGQFLLAALTSECRAHQMAPSLVGTAEDVRDLVQYRLHGHTDVEGRVPILAQGWRSKLVGELLDDLLAGRRSIRIQDPLSSEPLAFEPVRRPDDAG